MRLFTMFLASALIPGALMASSYHACSAPLILPLGGGAPPVPEVEFTLTIRDQGPDDKPFVAQGHTFDGSKNQAVLWTGMWAREGVTLHLIGRTKDTMEWRAQSVVLRDDVRNIPR